MSTLIDRLESAQLRKVPAFDPGDRVRVHFQVIEGNRSRTQVFEGFVIKRQGSGLRETFTVRKQSFGVGVERTFPVHSPKIEQIEVAARGEVRRAKLYYLRDRIGKAARVRERTWAPQDAQGTIDEAELVPPEDESELEQGGDEAAPQDQADAAPATADETADAAPADESTAQDEPVADESAADDAPSDDAPSDDVPQEGAPAADADATPPGETEGDDAEQDADPPAEDS